MHATIRRDAGRVLIVGFPERTLTSDQAALAAAGALGGVIVFKRNLDPDVTAVAAMVADLHREWPAGDSPLVAVDQEGGRVARLKRPVLELPPMRRLGEIDDLDLTRRAARALGHQLHALGLGIDFAPVLDVDTNPDNPIIGDRSFGRTAEVVTRHGLAFADGLADAGIVACGKHFPGHGDTDLDSHLALPCIAHDRARLDAVELAPFRAARGRIPMIMTAHVVFEGLDPGVPATLSRRVIDGLLRHELGYDGVIVSDDLDMKAVADHWGVAESAVRAIEAGCDALLVCVHAENVPLAYEALVHRAEVDAGFAARLAEAARRVDALPRVPAPDPALVFVRLAAAGGEAVESALRARVLA